MIKRYLPAILRKPEVELALELLSAVALMASIINYIWRIML